jgi:small-conductance mechanosensitive channel
MEALTRIANSTSQTLNETSWFGNNLKAYLLCLLIILVGFVILRVLRRQVLRRLRALAQKTEGTFDDVVVELVGARIMPGLYALLVYHALSDLTLQSSLSRALQVAVTLVLAWQGVQIVTSIAQEGLRGYWKRHHPDTSADREKSLKGVVAIIRVAVWVLAGILVMDNLGIKVSAFMAGLGITGIAVALAAQTVLGDLFAYFVIFFDKPFEVGHAIKVGDTIGEIEHIGLKTTRLRSLSGEQVVVSNKSLTDAKVQNFRKMTRRRALFQFEIAYASSEEILRTLPGKIKEIITAQADATFDRCHFMAFAESGLRFEVVFFVEVPDYARYMDIQQEVLLQIKATVEGLGTGFAFPTRTVHVTGGTGISAALG